MKTIQCHDLESFTLVCAAMVREGLSFQAHTATLTVVLTGGF